MVIKKLNQRSSWIKFPESTKKKLDIHGTQYLVLAKGVNWQKYGYAKGVNWQKYG